MSKKKFLAKEAHDLIKKGTDLIKRGNKVLAHELTEEEKDRNS